MVILLLKETGYIPKNKEMPQRLGVYLTNALEEVKDTSPFNDLLTQEAKAAAIVKRDVPVSGSLW